MKIKKDIPIVQEFLCTTDVIEMVTPFKCCRCYSKKPQSSLCDIVIVLTPTLSEDKEIINISATIHVSRDSQKGIIIGQAGKAIKKLGIESRREIEKFVDKRVFLKLFVKVTKDWRDKDISLKNL